MDLLSAEAWLSKRVAGKLHGSRAELFRGSFPEQLAYVRDPSPLKALFCTRRAAKTYSWGLEAIDDSYDWPRANYLFLGVIREEAKRMFWKEVLKDLDEKRVLGIHFNESSLTATMPNGATIYVGAADANEQEMRKLLGLKYRKVRIDEAQDWVHTDLNELVFSVLKPACADYRGSISVSGTPGKLLKGFFRGLTPTSVQAGIRGERNPESVGWSVHCWDTHSNTAVVNGSTCTIPRCRHTMAEHWAAEIAELKQLKPGVELTPAFRRNYLGEWVLDETDLVYNYQANRNDFSGTLPNIDAPGHWRYVLGIDLGYEDATSFQVWTWHGSDKNLYGLQTFKKTHMDVTAAAQQAKAFDRVHNVEAMVIDGANKQAVVEMTNRHDLPKLIPADKTGKSDFIELMNADYITGRIKISPQCADLKEEYSSLIWDAKKLERTGKHVEHPACENHAADAALYGWRYCYQFLSKEPERKPARGTQEWAKQQERALFERAQRDAQKAKREYQLGDFGGQMDDWGGGDSSDWGGM